MTELSFSNRVEAAVKHHESAILTLLKSIAEDARVTGYKVDGPNNLCDDCYQWAVEVENLSVLFEVHESPSFGEGEVGISVGLSIIGPASQVLMECRPYNHTAQCWVNPENALEIQRRLHILMVEMPYFMDAIYLHANVSQKAPREK